MLRILSLLIVLFCMIGCDSVNLDFIQEATETRTWAATGINQIDARTINGEISIEITQDTIITAEITRSVAGEDSAEAAPFLDSIVITEDVSGGVLTLEADVPDVDEEGRNYRADFDFTTPESIFVDLAIVNGAGQVRNMKNGAEIGVVNGSITTENLEGGVLAFLINGSIDCDLTLLAAADSAVLSITNGDAVLSLPSDVSATFDARTQNGTVTITGFASVSYDTSESNYKAGTLGAGDAYIDINVGNGDITLEAR